MWFHPKPSTPSHNRSIESWWSLGGKELLASSLGDTVRKREFEALGEELLDVWSLDVVGLLELNNLENLQTSVSIEFRY
jgi:hypothetical protein